MAKSLRGNQNKEQLIIGARRLPAVNELYVDDKGYLHMPEEILQSHNIEPGTRFAISETPGGLLLKKVESPLTTLYIEPTSDCNLNCRTCIRNSWNEPVGFMKMKTYHKLIEDLRKIPSLKKISFWGLGEPLLHPGIVEMVSLAGKLGAQTQIITNGLLLDKDLAAALVEAGLNTLVVSIDGATPGTYAGIRSGGELGTLTHNLLGLRDIRRDTPRHNPELGIEFVIMRRNVQELDNLHRLAVNLGASFIVLTNLLPYSDEMKDEIYYGNNVGKLNLADRHNLNPHVFPPFIDLNPKILKLLNSFTGYSGTISLPQFCPDVDRGYCRFVGEGSASITWDGGLSPCVALMHSYTCYVMRRKKDIRRYIVGNVAHDTITSLFGNPDYVRFRERVQRFDFSPCSQCSGCELAESNQEDCFGNTFPVCGDCLWACGVIQCP